MKYGIYIKVVRTVLYKLPALDMTWAVNKFFSLRNIRRFTKNS